MGAADKQPADMVFTLAAHGDTPAIAIEPRVIPRRPAHMDAAGCLVEAAYVEGLICRIGAGMLVGTADVDLALDIGY
jgi:hypothetical protein